MSIYKDDTNPVWASTVAGGANADRRRPELDGGAHRKRVRSRLLEPELPGGDLWC